MSSIAILRKKILIVTNFLIVTMIIVSGAFIIPGNAASTTTVKVDPLNQTVSHGSSFTVNILCVPNQPIKSYEFKIMFNPSLLKANSVTKGNIFNSYSTFFNEGVIDNTAGTIKNIYNVILGSGTVSSSGTFVSISFTAKSTSGTSSINLNAVGVTNSAGYIPLALTNGSVQVTQSSTPSPPVFDLMTPANKSTNMPISTSSLSLSIRDPNGDSFDYTIQTQPNVGRVAVYGTRNGTKQCTISGLKYSTTYRWYVNATDGVSWKRRWYTFTTSPAPSNSLFSFSIINPGNGSRNIPISTALLSLTIQNSKGHPFNYYIRTDPRVGSTSGVNRYNGTKTCSISNLNYSTTYSWTVSCKDSITGQWGNQTYSFTTESNNQGGNPPGGGGSTPPVNETLPPLNNQPSPPASPTGPTNIQAGVNYYYTTSAFDPDNDTIRIRFNWGDGTYSNWTGLIPSNVSVSIPHSWMNLSSYNISVIAQDEHGLNSSWSDSFNVTISQAETENESAIIEILASSGNISTNESILFDASTCYVPGSTIVSYQWEFGDGKKSIGKKTTYSYTTPGQYAVILTVTDSQGETYNNKIIVTVAAGAEVIAQNALSFLSILITSGLIGIVVILILILILLSRGIAFVDLGKKYLAYSIKWMTPFTTKITRLRQSKSITSEPKPKTTIPHFLEEKSINTVLHSSLTDDYEKGIDDVLLQKIHEKIDRL